MPTESVADRLEKARKKYEGALKACQGTRFYGAADEAGYEFRIALMQLDDHGELERLLRAVENAINSDGPLSMELIDAYSAVVATETLVPTLDEGEW